MKLKTLNSIIILLLVFSCTTTTKESKKTTLSEEDAKKSIVDLTHTFSEETVYWVTAKEFHLDAPIHFSKGKQTVEELPLEKLVGPAIKIDVSKTASKDVDYLITIQDFLDWETTNGQIKNESIVLLETGHSKYYPDKLKYLGTDQRGPDAIKLLHFPGLSPEAATWLVENRNINAIGIDTPSIDYGQSEYFKTHVILLSENIPVFENVANLSALPSKGFEVVALPMKIKDGSGAPLRIIALVNDSL